MRAAPSCGRCPTARADKLLAATPEEFERELERDFDRALGGIRLASERLKFPLWRMSADAYVIARVALVGDAATWCIHWQGRARISVC
jgi:2-polyprenyl-6-methoxyphenol hydroxylase-like FAD-dependent oxidoreductase